jgi:hypothetical protein
MLFEERLFETLYHPCPPGTKAIVLCEDFFCIAIKAWDGIWRDKYENILKLVKVVAVFEGAWMHG